MIIKDFTGKGKIGYGREIEVFGIYWNDGVRVYFVIPYDGYEGFLALNEKETEIVDPRIKDVFVLVKYFFHGFLDSRDETEDDLSELQSEAVPDEVRKWLASTFAKQEAPPRRPKDERPSFK